MDIDNILQQLRHQAGRLDAAISALEGGAPRRGRPRKASQPTAARQAKRSGPRHMSAAARAKIVAAQRARWAKQKAGGTPKKSAAKKASAKKAGRKGMSAAARKRMSELMKQRWAARKKSA